MVAGSLGLARRACSTLPTRPKVDMPKGYLDEPSGVPLERNEGKDYKFFEYPSAKHLYRISMPELLQELTGLDVPAAMNTVKDRLAELEQRKDLDAEEAHDLEMLRNAFEEMKQVESEEGVQQAMLSSDFEHTALDVPKDMSFDTRFELMLYNLLVTGQELGRNSKATDLKTLYGKLRKTTAAAKQPAPADYRKPLPTDRYESCGEVLTGFLQACLPPESQGHSWTVHIPKSERVHYCHWNDPVHLPFGHTTVPMRTWSDDQVREVHLNFHYRMLMLLTGGSQSATTETFVRVPADWLLAFKRHRWPALYDENTTFWPKEHIEASELVLHSLHSDVLPLRADMSSEKKAVPFPVRRNHPIVTYLKREG